MRTITVKVAPNKKEDKVIVLDNGVYLVWLKAKPIEGQANNKLIKVLADYFNLPKSLLTIKSGTKSRLKVIEINE